LKVLADRQQGGDAIADSRSQLLRRAAADVSRSEDAGHGGAEAALVIDEAARVEVDAALQERGVGIEPDEHECGARGEDLLRACATAPDADGFKPDFSGELAHVAIEWHHEARVLGDLVLKQPGGRELRLAVPD